MGRTPVRVHMDPTHQETHVLSVFLRPYVFIETTRLLFE